MDVIEIIREAVYYPLNDTKGWGLIAAIFVVVGILQQLAIQYPDSATIFHFFHVHSFHIPGRSKLKYYKGNH